jgi:hypothetical protein
MKRIVVQLSGVPFDPTYEIDDDTIAIGDLVVAYPAAAQPSSKTARPEPSSPWKAPIPDHASAPPEPTEQEHASPPAYFRRPMGSVN